MSSSNVGSHRRLIVELAHGATDARTLRAVAELAASLQLELHGLFIEDEDLLGLAELPFAREIRLPTHDWQKLEAGRVAAELQHAAGEAHRLLRSLAEALGIAIAFEVRRGDPGKMMAAVASGGDVIVLAAPAAPALRLVPAFARVQEAARSSAASLLLLAGGPTPRHAPVVALLSDAADPALAPAVLVAVNTGERLLLLVPEGDEVLRGKVVEQAVSLGLPRRRVTVRTLSGLQPENVLHALGHVRERLLVLTRGASAAGEMAAASEIAAARGVPVLVV